MHQAYIQMYPTEYACLERMGEESKLRQGRRKSSDVNVKAGLL